MRKRGRRRAPSGDIWKKRGPWCPAGMAVKSCQRAQMGRCGFGGRERSVPPSPCADTQAKRVRRRGGRWRSARMGPSWFRWGETRGRGFGKSGPDGSGPSSGARIHGVPLLISVPMTGMFSWLGGKKNRRRSGIWRTGSRCAHSVDFIVPENSSTVHPERMWPPRGWRVSWCGRLPQGAFIQKSIGTPSVTEWPSRRMEPNWAT